MAKKRYVTASEASAIILEGAALYGRAMDTAPSTYSDAWTNWITWRNKHPNMVDAVDKVQRYAFLEAQRLRD